MLALSLIVGVLDGFGLAMFLPLLEMVADQNALVTPDNLGNLSFLIIMLQDLGIELDLILVLIVILMIFCIKGAFKYIESYKNVVYRQYFVRNLRESNIKSLANFKYQDFVNNDAGRIQNSMSGEVGRVVMSYQYYMKVIQQSVLLLVYSSLALIANPQFAILVVVGGLITNLFFIKLYKVTKFLSREITSQNHIFQGLLIQQVAFFKYLKATGLINTYAQKLIKNVYAIESFQRKIGVLAAIIQGIREPLLIGVVVAVILIQIQFLGGTLGLIILSILFFYRALTAIMNVQIQWNQFLAVSGSLENMTKFTNELVKGREKTGKINFGVFNKEIKLENIGFSFGDTSILSNINFLIHKNETIAFVGESGSGKTTLMNIISGLLKPQSGRLIIDGTCANDLNISTYQKRIGYITQEPAIFDDTIFNNVTFWTEKTTDSLSKFELALKQAHIYDFVNGLHNKEESRLGNNGINLSGGQKQRISIARELYKDVDFLFMDEATSSLDSETEKEIQENIEILKGKYTIIIIAHRLSTIKNADRVVVLKSGKIEKIGSYNNLIVDSFSFKKMVELQEV